MVSGFHYIISFTADSTLQAAIDKKKNETIPLAGDGKSFDSCIDAARAMVPIEFSVITSVVLFLCFPSPFWLQGAAFVRECSPSFSKRPQRPRGNM